MTLNQWQQVHILIEICQVDRRCVWLILQTALIKSTITTSIARTRRFHLPVSWQQRLATWPQWRDTQSMAAGPYIDEDLFCWPTMHMVDITNSPHKKHLRHLHCMIKKITPSCTIARKVSNMATMTWHSIHGSRSIYWWTSVKLTDDGYGRYYKESS